MTCLSSFPFSSSYPTTWVSVKGCTQYLFDGPAQLEPGENYMTSPAFFFGPSGNALSFAVKREKCVAPSISCVLFGCCPPYVSRFVILFRVYTVKLKPLSRVVANALAYVGSKHCVIRPIGVHGYPASPVIGVGVMGRAVTPLTRTNPTGVKRRSNFAVVGTHPSLSGHQCKEALQP